MLKSFTLLLRTFFRSYRPFVAIWIVCEVVASTLLHRTYHLQALETLRHGDAFWFTPPFALLVAAFAVLSIWQAVALGWIFNQRRRASWMQTLPVTSGVMLAVPVALIGARAAYLTLAFHDLFFVDAPLHSQTVWLFLLVLPLTVFTIVRHARTFVFGAAAAAAVGVASLWVYASTFVPWQEYHAIATSDVGFAAVLAFVLLAIEKKSRIVAALTGALLIVAPLGQVLWMAQVEPRSLLALVAALKIYPTAPNVARLQAFARDPSAWSARDAGSATFLAPSLASALPLAARRFLGDDDRLALTARILANVDAFQTPGASVKNARYPLDFNLIATGTSAWLAAHWRDEEPYCVLAEAVLEYGDPVPIDVVMHSSCAAKIAPRWEFWRLYRPWAGGPYEQSFERMILTANTAELFGARLALYKAMINFSNWKEDKAADRDRRAEELLKNGLDAPALAAWRQTYLAKDRTLLKRNMQSVEALSAWLDSVDRADWPQLEALQLLCDQLASDCHDYHSVFRDRDPLSLLVLNIILPLKGDDIILWEIKRKIRESPRLSGLGALASVL